jgi:nitrate reductase gamma subunit
MSSEFITYVVYPVSVAAIVGTGAFLITRLIKYFNKLDSTLVDLTKAINLLILDQTKIHGEQDARMGVIEESISTVKVIQNEHRKDINELFDGQEVIVLEIEKLKLSKEDK